MKTLRTKIRASAGLLGLCALVATPGSADFVIADDLIVQGSACVGLDCVNNENFGFDTIRLKENNLRIAFDDTSTTTGFPKRDWQITANDSGSGGAEKFSIEDLTAARIPFTIRGNAPTNSLFVDANGKVGLRTGAPVLDLHIKTGNTPAIRLEQDSSSGFTPQTWDIAGNETNFFVRDATGGSALPFRIQPGAPSNSIFISQPNGDVGIGTNAPNDELHIRHARADDVIALLESTNATAQNVGFSYVNSARTWTIFSNSQGNLRYNVAGGLGTVLEINGANGNVTINQGSLSIPAGNCSDQAGGGGCTPDYVFEPDYELMSLDELAAFVEENKHLPNVPSAAENQKNGIDVRRLSFAMLEKIEELVLYTLEQQETIRRQDGALQELAETNAGLAQRLEALEGRVSPAIVQ